MIIINAQFRKRNAGPSESYQDWRLGHAINGNKVPESYRRVSISRIKARERQSHYENHRRSVATSGSGIGRRRQMSPGGK